MASKFKRRLGFGCGIFTLLGMGFVVGILFSLVGLSNLDRKAKNWQSEESRQFVTNHFQRYLKLTPEQREKIEPVISEGLKERWTLRRDYYAETDRLIVEKYIPRINKFLSDEQTQRLQKRLVQWRKDHNLPSETIVAEPQQKAQDSGPTE